MRNVPSGSLKFKRAKATGLIFDPFALTSTPPNAPLMPANSFPRVAADLSFVMGGILKVAEKAVLSWPDAYLLVWRVHCYDEHKGSTSFQLGPPRVNPN